MPEHGVDISHRGGRPGFVRQHGDRLTIDDYAGNNFFNTLGNLTLNPRAGLLFPEMKTGAMLHVAVRAGIETIARDVSNRKQTNRRLHVYVTDAWHVAQRRALQWGAAELSQYLL